MKLSGKILAATFITIIVVIATSYAIGVMVTGPRGSGALPEVVPPQEAMGFDAVRVETAATRLTGGVEYSSARMLVRTGSIELESEDPEVAADKIIVMVESYGGYVARLSSSGGEKKSVSMVVKIPESVFYKVLAEIRRIGRVVGEDVSVQDVTEQYIDLEARLKNLRAEEEWLLAAVEKAQSVQDLLMIEKELWRVRGEIERIEAQLKNLERMVAYSSISIWIRMPEEPEPSPYPMMDFTPVLAAAVTALIHIAYGLVFLIIVGSPLGLMAYGGYLIYRRISGRRSQASPQNISPRQH
jgi:hypothetical protein